MFIESTCCVLKMVMLSRQDNATPLCPATQITQKRHSPCNLSSRFQIFPQFSAKYSLFRVFVYFGICAVHNHKPPSQCYFFVFAKITLQYRHIAISVSYFPCFIYEKPPRTVATMLSHKICTDWWKCWGRFRGMEKCFPCCFLK